jgi:hypothetical protein
MKGFARTKTEKLGEKGHKNAVQKKSKGKQEKKRTKTSF